MKSLLHAFVAGFLVLIGVSIYNSNMPVVIGMKASFVEASEPAKGVHTADVYGWKIRDCSIVAGSFVGWYKILGDWHETPLSFPDDTSPDSTRPSGLSRQSFGLFQWEKVPIGSNRVRVTLQHDCDGSVRTTVAGNWSLPKG